MGVYIYAYNGEEVLTAMICWVTVNEHKTVYFTQNHGETADPALTNLFSSAGYYVELLNLRTDEVPENAALVVVSAPTFDFERSAEGSSARSEPDRLANYLGKGGNIYFNLDPAVTRLTNLEAFLAECGFAYSYHTTEDGITVRDTVFDDVNAITNDGSRVMVAAYRTDNSGKRTTETVCDFTISNYAFENIVMNFMAVLNGETVNTTGGYVDSKD